MHTADKVAELLDVTERTLHDQNLWELKEIMTERGFREAMLMFCDQLSMWDFTRTDVIKLFVSTGFYEECVKAMERLLADGTGEISR